MDMTAFTLVVATRRLRPYFQTHPIKVLTNTLLKKMLQRPDASRLLMNWAIELSKFDIEYYPYTVMK